MIKEGPGAAGLAGAPGSADQLLVVDCLLPPQIRKLGQSMTYLTARRAIKTSAQDCEIRGGEYVAYDRANYATALKVWLPLAQQGDAAAQTYVGEIYEKGLGIQPDYQLAVQWYRKAADQGYSRAEINLGYLYEKGLGVNKDLVTALNWYRKASGLDKADLAFASTVEVTARERREKDQEVRALRGEVARRTEEARTLRAQLRQVQGQLHKRKTQMDSVERDLERTRQQLQERKAAPPTSGPAPVEDTARIKEAEARLQEAEELRARLAKRQAELQRDQSQTDARKAEIDAKARRLEEERQALERQRQLAGISTADLKRQEDELAKRAAELDRQRASLQSSESEARRRGEQLATELDAAKQNEETLRQQLQRQQAEAQALREQLARSQAQLSQTQARQADLEAQRQALASQSEASRAQNKAEVQRLEAQLAAREAELKQQREAVSQLQTQAQHFEDSLTKLTGTAAPTQESASGPIIEIIEPPLTVTRGISSVTLRAPMAQRDVIGKVTAAAGLMSLTVNDRPETVDSNGLFHAQVPINTGETPVNVTAVDRKGRRASVDFVLVPRLREAAAEPTAPPAEASQPVAGAVNFGDYYALVIGNNNYTYLPRLESAARDAQSVSQLLKSKYGFKVTLLINATRYQILSALNQLREKLTEKDNLLIYYAGHGELDRANLRGNWLPVDAEPDSTANWISTSSITDILNAMSAVHILVVADSCYSGAMTRSALARLEPGMSNEARVKWLNIMTQTRSRTVLSSGGLKPVLDAGGGDHSLFAAAFLDALRNNKKVLEGQDLYRVVADRVRKAAARLDVDQVPEYGPIQYAGHEGGVFFFVPHGAMISATPGSRLLAGDGGGLRLASSAY